MIWSSITNREGLLEILQNPGAFPVPITSHESLGGCATASPGRIVAIWQDEPGPGVLPTVIAVNSRELADFLAWAATYITSFRPFTSYFRVLTEREVLARPEYGGPRPAQHPVNVFVGLVLGETLAYLDLQPKSHQLTLAASRRTLSFALAKGAFQNAGAISHDTLAERWYHLRTLTGQPELPLNRTAVLTVWQVLQMGRSPSSHRANMPSAYDYEYLAHACRELLQNGEMPSALLEALMVSGSRFQHIHAALAGPRELRVSAVEDALSTLVSSGQSARVPPGFLAGYLVSRIGPGSLQHMGLLYALRQAIPDAIIWYGFCAGVVRNAVVNDFAGGLGWRIRREIERSENLVARPQCDVAYSELELLLGQRVSISDIPLGTPGQMEVELHPGINTVVRVHDRSQQAELFDRARTTEIVETVTGALSEAIRNLVDTQERIRRNYRLSPPEQQLHPEAPYEHGRSGRGKRRK